MEHDIILFAVGFCKPALSFKNTGEKSCVLTSGGFWRPFKFRARGHSLARPQAGPEPTPSFTPGDAFPRPLAAAPIDTPGSVRAPTAPGPRAPGSEGRRAAGPVPPWPDPPGTRPPPRSAAAPPPRPPRPPAAPAAPRPPPPPGCLASRGLRPHGRSARPWCGAHARGPQPQPLLRGVGGRGYLEDQ